MPSAAWTIAISRMPVREGEILYVGPVQEASVGMAMMRDL
jgi:hypothetical protein